MSKKDKQTVDKGSSQKSKGFFSNLFKSKKNTRNTHEEQKSHGDYTEKSNKNDLKDDTNPPTNTGGEGTTEDGHKYVRRATTVADIGFRRATDDGVVEIRSKDDSKKKNGSKNDTDDPITPEPSEEARIFHNRFHVKEEEEPVIETRKLRFPCTRVEVQYRFIPHKIPLIKSYFVKTRHGSTSIALIIIHTTLN
jgi:hypothetical protein